MQLSFARAWGTSVSLPVTGVRPRERMRIDPRIFTADRTTEMKEEGSKKEAAVQAPAGASRGKDASGSASSSSTWGQRKQGGAADNSAGFRVRIDVDDPLYILLPDKLQALPKMQHDNGLSPSSLLPESLFPVGPGQGTSSSEAGSGRLATVQATGETSTQAEGAGVSIDNSPRMRQSGARAVVTLSKAEGAVAAVPQGSARNSPKDSTGKEQAAKGWLTALMHTISGSR
jgi:hypothetical protein